MRYWILNLFKSNYRYSIPAHFEYYNFTITVEIRQSFLFTPWRLLAALTLCSFRVMLNSVEKVLLTGTFEKSSFKEQCEHKECFLCTGS
jgi:hypothetical protein